MKRKFLKIIFFVFIPALVLFSQDDINSLKDKLGETNGKAKADLLLTIAGKYLETDLTEAQKNCSQALALSKEINYHEGIANSHYLMGKIYFARKELVEALKSYDNALKSLPVSGKVQVYAPLISSISEIYLTSGIYDKALENYMQLLNYYRENEDKKGEAYVLSYIGETYRDLQNGENSLKYLQEALDIAQDINDEERISFVLNSIGGVYIQIFKDNDTAQSYYNRALELSQKIDYKLGIAKAYHNLGLVHYNKGELEEALDCHKKSLEIVEESNFKEGLVYNYNSLANIYMELGDLNSAIEHFKNSLKTAKEEQITIMIADNYKGLAESYKRKNNFKEAFANLELYNETKEKLNNEKTAQRIAEVETQYEILRRESENEILKRANTVQRNYFIFSVVLALVIVVILFSRYRYSRKAQKELEELNATKDKLFSIIGHDLKNPFGTLINFSEMLIEDYLELTDEEKITYIHMINEASQTGHEILDNLLQWSKTQSGKLEFTPQPLELQQIVDANITLLNSSANNKGVEIFSTVNSGIKVYADKNMLKTVLRNLIGNAIKFSHKGGTIKISCHKNGLFAEVIVSDNGVGMNEETKNKLFNPQIYYSTTGTANEQGTGLGLLLCKEFVERNGGEIWVESEENKGSDFKFTVPITS